MGTSFIGIQVHAAQSASTTEIALAPDPPLSLRAYVSRSRGMLLVIAVTIFGIFHPTVIVPYAFSDDYSLLWMADTGEPSPQFGKNILDATAISGRPFAGLLTQFFFSTAGTIDNLRFVRLFAILGIVALAILLHWALVRSGINPTFAAFMAILMCTLPAFQVFGS